MGEQHVAAGAHHEERRRRLGRLHGPVHGLPVHGGAPVLHQQGKGVYADSDNLCSNTVSVANEVQSQASIAI